MTAPYLITVYGKPRCVMCDATYRHLNKLGIPYVSRAIDQHPDVLAEAQRLGHLQAPIVTVLIGDDYRMWSGYRNGDIRDLSVLIKEAAA